MNDKIYFNLESEISKNYQVVLKARKTNKKLEEEQLSILKDIDLMFDVIKNEQMLLNKKFLEVLENDEKEFEKKEKMHQNKTPIREKANEAKTAGEFLFFAFLFLLL